MCLEWEFPRRINDDSIPALPFRGVERFVSEIPTRIRQFVPAKTGFPRHMVTAKRGEGQHRAIPLAKANYFAQALTILTDHPEIVLRVIDD